MSLALVHGLHFLDVTVSTEILCQQLLNEADVGVCR